MLKFSRYLQFAIIILLLLFVTGCYTQIRTASYQRYQYREIIPYDETAPVSDEEQAEAEEYVDDDAEYEEYVEEDEYDDIGGLSVERHVRDIDEPYTVINNYYDYYDDGYWGSGFYNVPGTPETDVDDNEDVSQDTERDSDEVDAGPDPGGDTANESTMDAGPDASDRGP